MHRSKIGVLTVGIALAVCAISNTCKASVSEEEFGRGLTAFHNGQMEQALDVFTGLIDSNTTDPRVYYFRGLVFLRSGRPEQADADFAAGAKLEANNNIRTYPINKSLQFVQGADRLKLEQIRDDARQKRKEMRQKVLELRYASGDAEPLPDASSYARPEVAEVADATLPSFTLAPLEIDQITAPNLNDLPPIVATVDSLTKGSSTVTIPQLVTLIDDTGVRISTSSAGGTSGGSDPFSTGNAGGTTSDPFSSGASDPFSSGAGNSGSGGSSDPFSSGGGSGEKKDDPFKSGGGGDPKDPFGG